MFANSLVLSHPCDARLVCVNKFLTKILEPYHLQAVRFIYKCYRNKLKGCIVRQEQDMKYELGVVAFLQSMYKWERKPSILITSSERDIYWLYHLKRHLDLEFYILTESNANRLIEMQCPYILIVTEQSLSILLEYADDFEPFCVVIDEIDKFICKRGVSKVNGTFNIGITTRKFNIDPEYKVLWHMINWVSDKDSIQKFADFQAEHKKHVDKKVEAYQSFWLSLSWNFDPNWKKTTPDELSSYKRIVCDWAESTGHKINGQSTSPSKRKTRSVSKSPTKKKRCKVRKNLIDWSSDEEKEPNVSFFLSRTYHTQIIDKPVGRFTHLLNTKSTKDIEKIEKDDETKNLVSELQATQSNFNFKSNFSKLKRHHSEALGVIHDKALSDEFSKEFHISHLKTLKKSKSSPSLSSNFNFSSVNKNCSNDANDAQTSGPKTTDKTICTPEPIISLSPAEKAVIDKEFCQTSDFDWDNNFILNILNKSTDFNENEDTVDLSDSQKSTRLEILNDSMQSDDYLINLLTNDTKRSDSNSNNTKDLETTPKNRKSQRFPSDNVRKLVSPEKILSQLFPENSDESGNEDSVMNLLPKHEIDFNRLSQNREKILASLFSDSFEL